MKFDDLLIRHIGELKKYQIIILLILSCEEIFIAMQTMAPVFTAAVPVDYWCRHPQLEDELFQNLTLAQRLSLTVPTGTGEDKNSDGLSKCSMYEVDFRKSQLTLEGIEGAITNGSFEIVDCTDEWMVDKSLVAATMVTEWNLFCTGSRRIMAKSIAAVFLAGMALGNLACGWLIDRFGRRPVFLCAGVSCLFIGTINAFVPNYIAFVVLRFVQGGLTMAKTTAGFVAAFEYMGPSRRALAGSIYFVFWACGICLLSGIAYCIRDWRYLMVAIIIPELLVYIIAYFRVPESPRWLYVMGRRTEADKIIQAMAKTNGVVLPSDIKVTVEVNKRVSPVSLVRTRNLRITTLIIVFVSISLGVCYYGLNFGVGNLGGNIYLNTLISGLVEIPANLCIIFLFTYVGRIPPFSGGMILGGIALLSSMALQHSLDYHWLFITLAMLGKFAITVVFSMMWMYCGECYPTCMRAIGLNLSCIASRISSTIGPFVILLASVHQFLPSIIYATFAIVSGVMVLFLPETRGMFLGQTVDEGEAFNRDHRFLTGKHRSVAVTSKHDTNDHDAGQGTRIQLVDDENRKEDQNPETSIPLIRLGENKPIVDGENA